MQIGDSVQWTAGGQSRRVLSLRLRTGRLVQIDGTDGIVETSRNRFARVPLADLQPDGATSTLESVVTALRTAHQKDAGDDSPEA